MRGFPLTEAKAVRWNSIVNIRQLKMLIASIAVGIIAGLFTSHVRLHLGLDGHKALFWMTPVIIARLLSRCKAGTTAGALSCAFTAFVSGGNLAGGILGFPLIGVAGIMLDVVINFLENRNVSGIFAVLAVGIAGMLANLICLMKRLFSPEGFNPNYLFGVSDFWFKLVSYAFFGLLAGVIAATVTYLINRRQKEKNDYA
jgi:hypothetical protein